MYKIFKSLIIIVWVMDIMNINVGNIHLLSWLEPILNDTNNLNESFWLIIWCVLPSADLQVKLNKEDK